MREGESRLFQRNDLINYKNFQLQILDHSIVKLMINSRVQAWPHLVPRNAPISNRKVVHETGHSNSIVLYFRLTNYLWKVKYFFGAGEVWPKKSQKLGNIFVYRASKIDICCIQKFAHLNICQGQAKCFLILCSTKAYSMRVHLLQHTPTYPTWDSTNQNVS